MNDQCTTSAAKLDEKEGQTLTASIGLTYVDFCPVYRRKNDGWFFQSGYETFSELFAKINAWLKTKPNWEVKCCETFMYDMKSTFGRRVSVCSGQLARRNARGVRLWLVPKSDNRSAQKLGCINVVPKIKSSNGIKTTTTIENGNQTTAATSDESSSRATGSFENLTEMTNRLNEVLRSKPIEGRILSAETVATPVTGNWNIDTECCYWDNNQLQNNPFVNIIRIYFEYGSPKHETLAFEDFVPSRDLWDSPLAVPNYEPFASVLKRASQWVQQHSVNFLSCQSIDVPLHNNWSTNDKQIESKNMFFEKPTNDFVLKFIRIAHIISKNVSQNEKTNLLLNCKIFVPSKSATTGEYEDCLTVKRKMETWLTTTGARILSAETTVIKLSYATSSVAAAVDSMFTSLSSGAVGSHWITIYRIYIDGQYLEPPFRLLPPIVDLEANDDSSCTLS